MHQVLEKIQKAKNSGDINNILQENNYDEAGEEVQKAIFKRLEIIESNKGDTFSKDFKEDLSDKWMDKIDKEEGEEENSSKILYQIFLSKIQSLKHRVGTFKLQPISPTINVIRDLNEQLEKFKLKIGKLKKKIDDSDISEKEFLISKLVLLEKECERSFKAQTPKIIRTALNYFVSTHENNKQDKTKIFDDVVFPSEDDNTLVNVVNIKDINSIRDEINKFRLSLGLSNTKLTQTVKTQTKEVTENQISNTSGQASKPEEGTFEDDKVVPYNPNVTPEETNQVNLTPGSQSKSEIELRGSAPKREVRVPSMNHKTSNKAEEKPRPFIGLVGLFGQVFYRISVWWLKRNSGPGKQPKKENSKSSNSTVASTPYENETKGTNQLGAADLERRSKTKVESDHKSDKSGHSSNENYLETDKNSTILEQNLLSNTPVVSNQPHPNQLKRLRAKTEGNFIKGISEDTIPERTVSEPRILIGKFSFSNEMKNKSQALHDIPLDTLGTPDP